jgi:hypothetical protein
MGCGVQGAVTGIDAEAMNVTQRLCVYGRVVAGGMGLVSGAASQEHHCCRRADHPSQTM